MEWIQALTVIASLTGVLGVVANLLSKRIEDTNRRIDDLREDMREIRQELREIRQLLYKVFEVPHKEDK
jgi:chaperonin cofactor prefoldin